MAKFAKYLFMALVLAIGFQFLGCVGSVAYREIDLTTDIRSSQILNLRNYGDTDIDFLRQSERLMKSGFLNTSVEEYGYYLIDYEDLINYYDPGWPYLHAVTLWTLPLIGIPTDNVDYRFEARLRIYDSNGVLIKDYQKTGSKFTQTAGLYYGHNPTRRVGKELRNLFRDILQMASMQSGEINQALLSAGPVTQEKDSEARAKITSSRSNSASSYSAPSYSYSDDSSSSGSSSSGSSAADVGKAIAETFKSPLQSGTYSLAGTQAKIRLTSIAKSGIFSYTNRQGGTGTGSYSIDGNRMTVQMEGYTFVYTVTSETSFSGNGETWVRTGF